MDAPKPTLVRAVLTHGIGFGVLMGIFFWVRDAIESHVTPWPRGAVAYGLVPLLGGGVYGCIYWWLERRSPRRP